MNPLPRISILFDHYSQDGLQILPWLSFLFCFHYLRLIFLQYHHLNNLQKEAKTKEQTLLQVLFFFKIFPPQNLLLRQYYTA